MSTIIELRDKGEGTKEKGQRRRDKGEGTKEKGEGTRDKFFARVVNFDKKCLLCLN